MNLKLTIVTENRFKMVWDIFVANATWKFNLASSEFARPIDSRCSSMINCNFVVFINVRRFVFNHQAVCDKNKQSFQLFGPLQALVSSPIAYQGFFD